MKVCYKCGLEKELTEFYRHSQMKDRRLNQCRSCSKAAVDEWRNIPGNREKWNAQRHKKNSMRTFGLTEAEYDYLYADPVCAGCGRKSSDGNRLVLDHNHETGKVRGLLCHDCNRTIATAHDDPDILRGLATYLEETV